MSGTALRSTGSRTLAQMTIWLLPAHRVCARSSRVFGGVARSPCARGGRLRWRICGGDVRQGAPCRSRSTRGGAPRAWASRHRHRLRPRAGAHGKPSVPNCSALGMVPARRRLVVCSDPHAWSGSALLPIPGGRTSRRLNCGSTAPDITGYIDCSPSSLIYRGQGSSSGKHVSGPLSKA